MPYSQAKPHMGACSTAAVSCGLQVLEARSRAPAGRKAANVLWVGSTGDGKELIVKDRADRDPLVSFQMKEETKDKGMQWRQICQVKVSSFPTATEAREFMVELAKDFAAGNVVDLLAARNERLGQRGMRVRAEPLVPLKRPAAAPAGAGLAVENKYRESKPPPAKRQTVKKDTTSSSSSTAMFMDMPPLATDEIMDCLAELGPRTSMRSDIA